MRSRPCLTLTYLSHSSQIGSFPPDRTLNLELLLAIRHRPDQLILTPASAEKTDLETLLRPQTVQQGSTSAIGGHFTKKSGGPLVYFSLS